MRPQLFISVLFLFLACSVDGHYVKPDAGSWLKHIRGNGAESVSAVTLAPDGSVLIAGLFQQTIDLGGGPLATPDVGLFIAKFDSTGNHIWSKRITGGFAAIDPAYWRAQMRSLSTGDFVIAGEFRGALTLGNTTLNAAGSTDVFIARFSANGDPVWARSGGTDKPDGIYALSVDPNDNIAACGDFNGSGSFFGSPVLSGEYVWLTRLTNAGDHSWSRAMPADFASQCGVASMSNGDVVFAGNFGSQKDTISVGGPIFTSKGLDFYMVRYAAADGIHQWSIAKGSGGTDYVMDMEAIGSSIVVTGHFSQSTSYGGSTLSAQGEADAFVAKFDASNGSHQLSISMGGQSADHGRRIAVRSDGQVTISGVFQGTANFGGTLLSAATPTTIESFVVDLDGMSGTVPSVRSIGVAPINDIATSAKSLVIGGFFGAVPITVLNQKLTPDGPADGYVILFKR